MKTRRITASAVWAIVVLILSGCSVGMAAAGRRGTDLSKIQVGATRLEIEHELGKPVSTMTNDIGGRTDVYEYQVGKKPSAGRAIAHGALDIMTLGIWELAGTAIELTGGETLLITVEYDAKDRVAAINRRVVPSRDSQPPAQAAAQEPGTAAGTGFFISESIVATNAHVVDGARLVLVHLGGVKLGADVLLQDRTNDLALLRIAGGAIPASAEAGRTTRPCLTLGNSEEVKAGDRVYTLGFPLAGILSTSPGIGEGLVNNSFGLDNDPRVFQISIPVQPGNSGGPLFDAQGRVIGVVTAKLSDRFIYAATGSLPQNVNFAIKAAYLRNLVALVPNATCATPSAIASGSLTPAEILQRYGGATVRIEASK